MKLKLNPNDFKLRLIKPNEDIAFILDTWMKSYRLSHFAKWMHDATYYTQHQNIVRACLTAPTNTTIVVCDPEDEDMILGYCCHAANDPIVYYIYIKRPFRGLGLGSHLLNYARSELPERPVVCTHLPLSWAFKKWRRLSKKLSLIYDPYITRGSDAKTKPES